MPDKEKSGAEIERKEENQFAQELKLADKLAIERTVMAADRTMLAGSAHRWHLSVLDSRYSIS